MLQKILLVHNYYQQRGGEDESFETEATLLRDHGHEVVLHTAHNDAADAMSAASLAVALLWNGTAYREVRALIRRERPSVVHCNNTFPLLSPSVYYAARAEGVPVVQHLRNYRLSCVNGLFFRDGRVCEDCLGSFAPWRGARHGCYRQSRVASAGAAAMVGAHRALGTWSQLVDLYVTLTEFARGKLVEAGLPADRVRVKPNFLQRPPAIGDGSGGYALFVGRLAPEKGVGTLLDAWGRLGSALKLVVVGDGPIEADVAAAAARGAHVEWLGRQPRERVHELVGAAQLLVFPSEWYETFGRVAMEAFAAGTPVIAARIGAVAEVVEDGQTGLHFRPGDAADLADKVRWALEHPDEWGVMRVTARRRFEALYTAERNYEMLMALYDEAKARASTRSSS